MSAGKKHERVTNESKRVHNKSGHQTLAVLRLNSDEDLALLEVTLKSRLVPGPEVVEGSRCKLWPNKKLKMTRPGARVNIG